MKHWKQKKSYVRRQNNRKIKVKSHKQRYSLGNLASHSQPRQEIGDYNSVLRNKIRKQRSKIQESLGRDFQRYKNIRLPSRTKVDNVNITFRELNETTPIEVKVGREKKVVDFKTGSRHMGAFIYPSTGEMHVDTRLLDKSDWILRKGTIAHEIQHLIDHSETTPRAVHNIVRQVLLQNDPHYTIIGNFSEMRNVASRKQIQIKKKLIKTPGEGDALLYFIVDRNNKKFAFAKDVVILTDEREYNKFKRGKTEKRLNLPNVRYKYVSYRFANIMMKVDETNTRSSLSTLEFPLDQSARNKLNIQIGRQGELFISQELVRRGFIVKRIGHLTGGIGDLFATNTIFVRGEGKKWIIEVKTFFDRNREKSGNKIIFRRARPQVNIEAHRSMERYAKKIGAKPIYGFIIVSNRFEGTLAKPRFRFASEQTYFLSGKTINELMRGIQPSVKNIKIARSLLKTKFRFTL